MKEIEIEFKEVLLKVVGTYEPEEPMVRYYPDGSGYPGSASDFNIDAIYVVDSEYDIYELFSMKDIEWLVDEVINKIEER